MSEDCLVIHHLSCAIVDSDTGEVFGKHDYKTGCEAITDKDSLLSSNRLASWLSSFQRGCYQKDNVTIQISYNKETIF